MAALPSARDVALDPEWLPHSFDADGQHLTSVFVPRAARTDLLFLSDGHFRDQFPKANFPVAAVAAEASPAAQAPIHFVFNTSFCCSTLLAKALDVSGVAASVREPNILVDLAERLIRADNPANRALLELGLCLLERPLAPHEAIVVKPSNFANRLAEPLLMLRPASRAVLLYSDAGTFLRSLLKRGLLARINGRKLYQNLVAWTPIAFGFSDVETFDQTDLQIAGLAWLMQIANLQRMVEHFGPERVMPLDAADLLADPAASLQRVESLFQLGLGDEAIDRIVAGLVFSKHSKYSDVDYDRDARESEHDSLMKVHGEELGMVLQWLDAVAQHFGIQTRPGTRTVGAA